MPLLHTNHKVDLSVITPVADTRADHLSETAASIAALRQELTVQWIVVWDGRKQFDVPEASLTLETLLHAGISCARNLALPYLEGRITTVVDADDTIMAAGCVRGMEIFQQDSSLGWAGFNRVFFDGAPTRHWKNDTRRFEIGRLAEIWNAPFVFHPNSVMIRTNLLKQIGGWPAISCNEDLGMILTASEFAHGCFDSAVLTRYRIWDKQEVAGDTYPERKKAAFRYIEAVINARRTISGRQAISSPDNPGGAWGTLGEGAS